MGQSENNPIKAIFSIFTPIALLVSIGVAWGMAQSGIKNNTESLILVAEEIDKTEESMEEIEDKQQKYELGLQRFEMQQMVIQTDVKQIEQGNQNIQQDLKSIRESLFEMKGG